MIKSFKDYKAYIEADKIALRKEKQSLKKRLKEFFFPDHIWKFQKRLRWYEYLRNTHRTAFYKKFLLLFAYINFRRISVKLGFSIPPNVFGPGLSIAHYGTIVVNQNAKIGANCRIHVGVVIGATSGSLNAPVLGDNVYIGSGAKILGNIKIPDSTVIGANSVVNKSFVETGCIIAGVPAKVIKKIDDPELKNFIPHLTGK